MRSQLIKNKEVFISCIIPVYNEEAGVQAFLQQLINSIKELTNRFEIIVVDDGSRDQTRAKLLEFAAAYPIKLLSFSRNFGKEIALTAGLEHCKGEVAILIDADFQHPIALLPTFLNEWASGYDMVYGVRQN